MTGVCPRFSKAHIPFQGSRPSSGPTGSVAPAAALSLLAMLPCGAQVPPGDSKGNSRQVCPFGLKMRGKNLARGVCHPHRSAKPVTPDEKMDFSHSVKLPSVVTFLSKIWEKLFQGWVDVCVSKGVPEPVFVQYLI